MHGSAALLRADVLLAPHLGSGTSSTPAFLYVVQPSIAIFQVGYRNRYHHLKAEAFARYRQLYIARMRTEQSEEIKLNFGDVIEATFSVPAAA